MLPRLIFMKKLGFLLFAHFKIVHRVSFSSTYNHQNFLLLIYTDLKSHPNIGPGCGYIFGSISVSLLGLSMARSPFVHQYKRWSLLALLSTSWTLRQSWLCIVVCITHDKLSDPENARPVQMSSSSLHDSPRSTHNEGLDIQELTANSWTRHPQIIHKERRLLGRMLPATILMRPLLSVQSWNHLRVAVDVTKLFTCL